MRFTSHILVLLLSALSITAVAQPQVTWLEQQLDMGVILENNGKASCDFRLVSSGSEPLIIVKAQAGCGCTSISYPEEPIPPGDTATVTLTYNPAGRPGQFSKQVIIFTNTTSRRSILEISGNVIPTDATLDKQYPVKAGALYVTQQNIPLGELTRGQNKTTYLSTYNASTDTIIVSAQGAKPHITPAVVPDTVPPGRVTALTVHYRSGSAPLWGLNVDTITLQCQPLRQPSTAEAGTTTINVMAQVLEDFGDLTEEQLKRAPIARIDCDGTLDFGAVKRGDVTSRSFRLTNSGKDKLIIRRLWTPQTTGVTINSSTQEIKRGKSATVTVTVDTSLIDDKLLNIPLTLLCNAPDNPRITVRLVGIIDNN